MPPLTPEEVQRAVANKDGPVDRLFVERLNKLPVDELPRWLCCTKSQVRELTSRYANDIGCTACVRQIEDSIAATAPSEILDVVFYEFDSCYYLRPHIVDSKKMLGRLFGKFNALGFLSSKKLIKRNRCSLHASTIRMDAPWEELWVSLPEIMRNRTACFRVEELDDALKNHLNRLYFCRECRGNVLRAFDLLVGCIDRSDVCVDDAFCDEFFRLFVVFSENHHDDHLSVHDSSDSDFDYCCNHHHHQCDDLDSGCSVGSVNYTYDATGDNTISHETAGDGGRRDDHRHNLNEHLSDDSFQMDLAHHSHVLDDDDVEDEDFSSESECMASHVGVILKHVPSLILRALSADKRDELKRAKGENSDRHAPTLRDGLDELLNCVGKFLLQRLRDFWTLHLVCQQTDEILLWLTLSCMRTNLEETLQRNGESAILELLQEEENHKAAKKKKRKKKKGKRKGALAVETSTDDKGSGDSTNVKGGDSTNNNKRTNSTITKEIGSTKGSDSTKTKDSDSTKTKGSASTNNKGANSAIVKDTASTEAPAKPDSQPNTEKPTPATNHSCAPNKHPANPPAIPTPCAVDSCSGCEKTVNPSSWTQEEENRLLASMGWCDASTDGCDPGATSTEEWRNPDGDCAGLTNDDSSTGTESSPSSSRSASGFALSADTGTCEGGLTSEEIAEAKAKLEGLTLKTTREELRAKLRMRFENLCKG